MNKVKSENLKTILIIALVILLITLLLDYLKLNDAYIDVVESQRNYFDSHAVEKFISNNSLIKKIESKNLPEALYFLYQPAKYAFDRITKNDLKKVQGMELFSSKYKKFMRQECMNNIIPACVNYGDILVQAKEYDTAYSIYKKAANAQDLNGVSRLVDLFYVKEWDKYSEETAKEYLLQLGK
jgi:tetratricopeptide (TPR) repeat protein